MILELMDGPMDGLICDVQEASDPILIPMECGLATTAYAVYRKSFDGDTAIYSGMSYHGVIA